MFSHLQFQFIVWFVWCIVWTPVSSKAVCYKNRPKLSLAGRQLRELETVLGAGQLAGPDCVFIKVLILSDIPF